MGRVIPMSRKSVVWFYMELVKVHGRATTSWHSAKDDLPDAARRDVVALPIVHT
ncbi:MAG: hypothetical protein ACKVIF_05120 [Rhodospirillales bacterium]|jgi:hypothetical protein